MNFPDENAERPFLAQPRRFKSPNNPEGYNLAGHHKPNNPENNYKNNEQNHEVLEPLLSRPNGPDLRGNIDSRFANGRMNFNNNGNNNQNGNNGKNNRNTNRNAKPYNLSGLSNDVIKNRKMEEVYYKTLSEYNNLVNQYNQYVNSQNNYYIGIQNIIKKIKDFRSKQKSNILNRALKEKIKQMSIGTEFGTIGELDRYTQTTPLIPYLGPPAKEFIKKIHLDDLETRLAQLKLKINNSNIIASEENAKHKYNEYYTIYKGMIGESVNELYGVGKFGGGSKSKKISKRKRKGNKKKHRKTKKVKRTKKNKKHM